MKKLFVFVLLLISLFTFSQGDQTVINIPGVEPALLHLPISYGSSSTKYPLLVFLHGKGEGGTNPSTIYNSSTAGGPAYFISKGVFPSLPDMIILSPQFANTSSGTSAQMLDAILQYMIKTYAVDVSRIYLTGLSEGGAAVVNYITHYQVNPTVKIAGAVIMSANIGQPSQASINQIITDKVNVWGFGSMSDVMGIQTRVLVQGAFGGNGGSVVGIGSLGKFTTFVGSSSNGHCCWNQFYDPAYTENGMNIYQWLNQFSIGGNTVPPVTTIPKVDSAGIIFAYLKTHPCPTIDTVSIGLAYVASHPCIVCLPQRSVKRLVNDIAAGTCYIEFTDGTTQQIK